MKKREKAFEGKLFFTLLALELAKDQRLLKRLSEGKQPTVRVEGVFKDAVSLQTAFFQEVLEWKSCDAMGRFLPSAVAPGTAALERDRSKMSVFFDPEQKHA